MKITYEKLNPVSHRRITSTFRVRAKTHQKALLKLYEKLDNDYPREDSPIHQITFLGSPIPVSKTIRSKIAKKYLKK